MNFYRSRLIKGPGYIDTLPDYETDEHMFEGVVYDGKIYFVLYEHLSIQDEANYTFRLYSWDGISKNAKFENSYTIDDPVDYIRGTLRSTGNFYKSDSTVGLVALSDGLYFIGTVSNAPFLYKLLPSYSKIFDYTKDTFKIDTHYESTISASSYDRYAMLQSKYVVYNNKIQIFQCPNNDFTALNKMLRSLGYYTSSNVKYYWSNYLGQHYYYNGNNSSGSPIWTKSSTSTICFAISGNPVVWRDKIYILTINYYDSDASNNQKAMTGLTIHCWNGTNWEVFYSKTGQNTIDSTNTSTSAHNIYYKDQNGNYVGTLNRYETTLNSMCVLNDELYIFAGDKDPYLLKYDENQSEFVIVNDSFPQEEDVIIEGSGTAYEHMYGYRGITLLPFNGYIYAIGGKYMNQNVEIPSNSHIYRYDPNTQEWKH